MDLWKYYNFQSEAKLRQIIAIVTTRSVSCKVWNLLEGEDGWGVCAIFTNQLKLKSRYIFSLW